MQTLDFTPAPITVRVVTGATVGFGIGLKRADGLPVDLTGYTITAPLTPRDGYAPPVASFTVVQVDPASLSLSLTADECGLLGDVHTPVSWSWSCWADQAGQRIELVHGTLALTPP
jgi:hypothetical protein